MASDGDDCGPAGFLECCRERTDASAVDAFAGGNNLYAYVGNDPLNNLDPNGLDTLSIGLSFSFQYFKIAGQIGAGLVIDFRGNAGYYYEYAGGAASGANLGLVLGGGFKSALSNGSTIGALNGPFVSVTGSGGNGVGGAGEYFVGRDALGNLVQGGSATVGFFAGAGVTIGPSVTTVIPAMVLSPQPGVTPATTNNTTPTDPSSSGGSVPSQNILPASSNVPTVSPQPEQPAPAASSPPAKGP